MQVVSTVENNVSSRKWIIVFIFCFLALVTDGADVMALSYSLSSIKKEFGLDDIGVGMLGSISLFGMGFGGVIGGWASDKFGRVRAVVVSILCFSIFTGILGFTRNFYEFAILRFIASLGLGTVYIVSVGLLSEFVPTKYRTTILATMQTGWTFGYIVAALAAGIVIPEFGWRVLFQLGFFSIILAILMHFFVPESNAWKNDQLNKKSKPQVERSQSTFAIIFKDKLILKSFILWIAASAFMHFGYYGVNNWMPLYLEKELGMHFKSLTLFMVGSYAAMVFGKILAGFMADKFGRRFTFCFGAVTTAIFLIIIVMYHTPGNILYFLIIFGFLYGIPFGVYGAYMTESFPTHVRGTAIGTAHNIGKMGSTIAPITIGFIASNTSIGMGFLVMGVAYLICAAPVLFIKEKMYNPNAES